MHANILEQHRQAVSLRAVVLDKLGQHADGHAERSHVLHCARPAQQNDRQRHGRGLPGTYATVTARTRSCDCGS